MSIRNQHTAALNLTSIRRNTRFFALLTFPQEGEVRVLSLEASARNMITTAGAFYLPAKGSFQDKHVSKAGVNVKAVFTSLNTAFLPISRSRFKRRQIPMLKTLSTIWQFCVNFWVIFRCFGKERFFLKG